MQILSIILHYAIGIIPSLLHINECSNLKEHIDQKERVFRKGHNEMPSHYTTHNNLYFSVNR